MGGVRATATSRIAPLGRLASAGLFEVGALARLPQAVLRVSPYASSLRLPGGTLDVLSVGALLVVAVVLGSSAAQASCGGT